MYVLVGDDSFRRDRFRADLLSRLNPEELELGLQDEDLGSAPLEQILDRARTPSLLVPRQIFWIRRTSELFSRGGGEEGGATTGKKKHGAFPDNVAAFAADFARDPAAVLVFVADHLHLPADRRRISLEDRGRLQRIEQVFSGFAELVECGQAGEREALEEARALALRLGASAEPAALQELVAVCEAQLATIARELEKLAMHAAGQPITVADVQALTVAARTASGFELAAALAAGRRASLETLGRLWADEGDGGAVGLVFQLSRVLQMALIARQQQARDTGALYRVLPEGLRPPGFGADAVLRVARALPAARLRSGIRGLHAVDVALRSSPPSPRLLFEQWLFSVCEAASAPLPRGSTAAGGGRVASPPPD